MNLVIRIQVNRIQVNRIQRRYAKITIFLYMSYKHLETKFKYNTTYDYTKIIKYLGII